MGKSPVKLPAELDLAMLDTCRRVERVLAAYGSIHRPVRLWTAFYLVKSERDRIMEELERLETFRESGVVKWVDDHARELREAVDLVEYRWVRTASRLETLLVKKGIEESIREFLIGLFVLESDVDKWESLTTPKLKQQMDRELPKLQEVAERYASLLQAVRELITPRPQVHLPEGVDREILEELHLAREGRLLLLEGGHEVQLWEILRLVGEDQPEARRCLAEIEWLGHRGEPAARIRAILDLYERIVRLREEKDPGLPDLEQFLRSMPGSPENPEVFEIALAFVMNSSQGRILAARWVHNPERYRTAAADQTTLLFERADRYGSMLF